MDEKSAVAIKYNWNADLKLNSMKAGKGRLLRTVSIKLDFDPAKPNKKLLTLTSINLVCASAFLRF